MVIIDDEEQPKGQGNATPVPAPEVQPPPAYSTTSVATSSSANQPLLPSLVANPRYTVPVPEVVLYTEPAGKRFLKAFGVAILVWILLGMVTNSITEAGYSKRQDMEYDDLHTAWPLPRDGKPVRCTRSAMDWSHKDAQAVASFDLPLDANVLYLLSRGLQSSVKVIITQDERSYGTDKVHIDVAGLHSTPINLHAVTVCSLERKPGHYGIGIFTPRRWRTSSRLPALDFEVTIRFPKLASDDPLRISSLQTTLENFSHHIGDLKDRVVFESLSIAGINAAITSESVNVVRANIGTSNGRISGHFSSSESLVLSTSNGAINADVTLYNDGERSRTSLTLKNSNGPITSSINLASTTSNHSGGMYDVVGGADNGRLIMDFPTAPVDSQLTLRASTSNAPVDVSLHPTYEGTFKLTTSNGEATINMNSEVQDPSGRGRLRSIETWGKNSSTRGQVIWGGEHLGAIVISTKNAGAKLSG